VHWALTARHGELIVRELQSNAVPRVQIVLDADPAVHRGAGPDGSREWALRVTASLAEGWIQQGAEVELVLDPARVSSTGGSGRARAAVVLDALARLGPGGDRNLAELLSRPECRRRDCGLRVVVTTDIGLRGLTGEGLRWAGVHFVVLEAEAFGFGRGECPAVPLPVAPWIRIGGPRHVPTCLRRIGTEAGLGC
jgi:uncharacterized protein (DUF58 family)